MGNSDLLQYLSISPVIPVVVLNEADSALPLAEALVSGGVNIIEITLRTECALQGISNIRESLPDMIVGAGTVTNVNSIQKAAKAGAHFLVSPGVTKPLLDGAHYHSIPLLPGASTPSEAMVLLQQGFQFQKFFPAEAAGGTKMLSSIAGPLPEITFCPTGGINDSNIEDYLRIKNVICAGSSWVAESDLIQQNNWSEITRRARQLSQLEVEN